MSNKAQDKIGFTYTKTKAQYKLSDIDNVREH